MLNPEMLMMVGIAPLGLLFFGLQVLMKSGSKSGGHKKSGGGSHGGGHKH